MQCPRPQKFSLRSLSPSPLSTWRFRSRGARKRHTSQTYHLATSALAELAAIIGSDKERARIFRIGIVDPDALTEDEFSQFGYVGISLFRRFENIFFQYQSGMIDEDFWVGHRDNILWFFRRPGMQVWWKDRKFGLSKRFREFLDNSARSEIASPETRRL